jgi:hypothetical protein
MTTNRNALRSAFGAAHTAANKVADIRLTLDIWSARQPLLIDEQSQRELRRLFNEVRTLLAEAEHGFEDALDALASPAAVQHVEPAVRSRRRGKGA